MKQYSFLIIIILIIADILVQTSCAVIVPPGGGPKDTLAPVLIKAVPADSALHFNTNKIVLTFNEYVQIDPQAQANIITSPNPNQAPFVENKLQTVTVRLKDTLKPNTTYSINFGKAIKDIDEGNPYKNFTYVFSTGSSIASGTLSGKVQLAQTGFIDSTLIVILHSNLNDSAIKKIKPVYYAALDSAGRFTFKYIAPGTYNVFVLPNDYTKKYDDSTKAFAFLNAPVIIDSTQSEALMMYAYNQYPPNKSGGAAGPINNPPPSLPKKKPVDTTKAITFSTNLQKTQDLLSNFIITFKAPLKNFDSSAIILSDTNYRSVANYSITTDTSLSVFNLHYSWKENEFFKLVIQKNAFTDSAGRTIAKNDTINIKTTGEDAYGSLRLRFVNLDLTRNPVIQFLQNNAVVDSAALTSNEFYRLLFKPGDYAVKILYDKDTNLTWTPGNYELKQQPEMVVPVFKKYTVKQNWDNETDAINL